MTHEEFKRCGKNGVYDPIRDEWFVDGEEPAATGGALAPIPAATDIGAKAPPTAAEAEADGAGQSANKISHLPKKGNN